MDAIHAILGNESKEHFWIRMDGFPSPWTSIDTYHRHQWPISLGAPLAPKPKKMGLQDPVSSTRCGRGPPVPKQRKKTTFEFASNLWSPMVRSSSTNCLPASAGLDGPGRGGFHGVRTWSEKKSSWEVEDTACQAWDVFVVVIWKIIYPKTLFFMTETPMFVLIWLSEHGALTTYFFYLTCCLNMDVTSCHNWNFQLEIVQIGENSQLPSLKRMA